MDPISRKFLWMACLCLLLKTGLSAPTDDDEYANDYANDEDEEQDGGYTGPPPEITSKGREIDIREGQNVMLPCEVNNADKFAVMWSHEKATLFVDATKMTQNKRLTRHQNNTLLLKYAQPADAGNYYCRISSAQDPPQIVFTINIIAPALVISRVPEEPMKIIEKGSALTLSCGATGSPVPNITWRRKDDKAFLNGNKQMTGTSLTFENVNRHYAGIYICTAENKYGADSATFSIKIHYAPEIEIAEETITTNVALEPEITCTVHADPAPMVSWYRSGVALLNSSHMQIHNVGNKHTLLIKGMQESDFDSYTCHASNKLGSARKSVLISGAPSRPEVKVSYSEGQLPELKWSVESHLPVQSYELRYKTANNVEKRIDAEVSDKEGNIYSGVAVLRDIVPGESEVIVAAKNEYGMSEPARFKVKGGESSSGTRSAVIFTVVIVSSIAAFYV